MALYYGSWTLNKGCESSLKIKPALYDIVASVQRFGSLLLTRCFDSVYH